MLLADPKLFTREHFEAHKGVAPAHLCELVVHCLELVSQLSASGLEYRFKGGNSLLILLEDPRRFSIDVDIVTTVPKQELIDLVERVTEQCEVFTRCEVRPHKTKPWLPMISFKLFFESVYQAPEDAYVMLDAVLEPPPYAGVRKQVRCGELYVSDATVEVPAVSGLLADKLLCIGPSTLGIPLGKGKEAQRIKHVFDVATLSRQPYELDVVMESLTTCMGQENELQKSTWALPDVVVDTKKFCSEPLEHADRPDPAGIAAGSYLDEIARGFDGFREFLFREQYTWPRFQDDCRRILALLEQLDAMRS